MSKVIYSILNTIKDTNSTNAKVEILKEYKDNELLKKVFYYTYNLYNFYMKKVPKVKEHFNEKSLEESFEVLDILRNRVVTGNEARALVQKTLSELSSEDADVFERILKKDLKIGMNKKLINRVWEDLIPITPYMGCRPYNIKDFETLLNESSEMYCDIKYDGEFVNIIVSGLSESGKDISNRVKTISRSGKDIYLEHLFTHLSEHLTENEEDFVLTGELLIRNMDRYTSNGIINSLKQLNDKIKNGIVKDKDFNDFIKKNGKTPEEIEKDIYVVVWDIISFRDWSKGIYEKPLKERREVLKKFTKNNIEMCEYISVNSKEEIFKYYNEKLQEGEEGIILKDANGIWKDGKHRISQKFKLIMDLDLIVKDFKYGNAGTKYSDKVNRLVLESSDGKLKTITGGVDEKTMDYLTDNKDNLVGKIATITCSGISKNNKGEWSVLHPRFKELRDDKNTANSLDECKEIEESTKSLNG